MFTFRRIFNYPGLALNIDRERASLIGLSAKNVVDNVITALTSDGMVAPSYWIDPKTGNNYMVTVQYANHVINHMSMEDFQEHPAARSTRPSGYDPMRGGQGSQRYMRPIYLMADILRAIRRWARWLRSSRSIPLPKSTITRFAG